MKSAIAKANQALIPRSNGDQITADELKSAAAKLQKTIKSVVSGGLTKSNTVVVEAKKLGTTFGEIRTKVSSVHKQVGLFVYKGFLSRASVMNNQPVALFIATLKILTYHDY